LNYHHTIINFLILLVILLGLSACEQAQQPGGGGGFPPPQVSVAEVIVKDVTPWIETSGRFVAKERVEIKPRVGGVIKSIRFREGAFVKKGSTLFVIDQAPYKVALNRAEAELARNKASAELATTELKRARSLVERKLIPPEEFDRRFATETSAKAAVIATEAAAKLARLNLEYTTIKSPINGRVSYAFITKGNLVASDPTPDVLTTVVSVNPIHVYFGSDEKTYLRFSDQAKRIASNNDIKQNPPVFIGLNNESDFPHQGFLDFIDNQLDPSTGSIRLRAVFDNSESKYLPGMFARVKIPEPIQVSSILIDEQAIITDQDKKYVYTVGKDGTAMRHNIKLGQVNDGLRMVTEGLQAGDKVIVYGTQKVFFPGMKVVPQPIKMGDPPPMPGPPPG